MQIHIESNYYVSWAHNSYNIRLLSIAIYQRLILAYLEIVHGLHSMAISLKNSIDFLKNIYSHKPVNSNTQLLKYHLYLICFRLKSMHYTFYTK